MTEFGERLTEALRLAGKDRKALAAHLGITVQAVGAAIREGKFTAGNTAKAARFLGVDWYWLSVGEGSPRPDSVGIPPADAELLSAFHALPRAEREQLLQKITERADLFRSYLAEVQGAAPPAPETEPTTASGLPVSFVEKRVAPGPPDPNVKYIRGTKVIINPDLDADAVAAVDAALAKMKCDRAERNAKAGRTRTTQIIRKPTTKKKPWE